MSPKDRDYLQFLWWDNDDIEHTEPKLYRMTVHLFGATSSPGCANFALKKLASDYKKEYSDASLLGIISTLTMVCLAAQLSSKLFLLLVVQETYVREPILDFTSLSVTVSL